MADPASLHNSQVVSPEPELWTAEILEDAAAPGQQVRCVIASKDPDAGTDPMRWMPYVTPDGFYYPKRGDEALIASPPDGPPWIAAWAPSPGSLPDVSF